jgi:hypothetical protein
MSTQKEIIEKYPLLFKNLRSGREKFECGKGWNDIIEETCHNINDFFEKFPEFSQTFIGIAVVKEKYGTLRIQGNFPDIAYEFIEEAVKKSEKVCEYCGAEGNLRNVWGWQKTICNACDKDEGIDPTFRPE